ncbi:alpha/beta fold hydrolase [Streptacidiphilus monticola]
MPTITVADARIPYTVTGEPGRRPLVLVHGTGPGAAITWGHLTPAWAATHLVVAPDLSGSAAAEDDGGELTVDRLAAQVIAVIEDLGADRPADVIGFSLGSPVAAAVAATRPDLVHRLVLIAGWADSAADPYLQTLFRTWIDAAPLPTVFGRISALTGFSTGFLAAAEPGLIEDLAAGMPPRQDCCASWTLTCGSTSPRCCRGSPRRPWSWARPGTRRSPSATPGPCTPPSRAAATPSWTPATWSCSSRPSNCSS